MKNTAEHSAPIRASLYIVEHPIKMRYISNNNNNDKNDDVFYTTTDQLTTIKPVGDYECLLV